MMDLILVGMLAEKMVVESAVLTVSLMVDWWEHVKGVMMVDTMEHEMVEMSAVEKDALKVEKSVVWMVSMTAVRKVL